MVELTYLSVFLSKSEKRRQNHTHSLVSINIIRSRGARSGGAPAVPGTPRCKVQRAREAGVRGSRRHKSMLAKRCAIKSNISCGNYETVKKYGPLKSISKLVKTALCLCVVLNTHVINIG